MTDKKIIDRIRGIQLQLANFACVDLFPEEYFHITVKELSRFLVSKKQALDEISKDELPILIKKVNDKFSLFKSFEIRLENLNNFKSTVCIQVHDGGIIRNINAALLQISDVPKLRNDWPRFLPHLSISQYKSKENYEQLIKHLEKNREMNIGSLIVNSIELVIAQLPIRGRYPKLKILEKFRL